MSLDISLKILYQEESQGYFLVAGLRGEEPSSMSATEHFRNVPLLLTDGRPREALLWSHTYHRHHGVLTRQSDLPCLCRKDWSSDDLSERARPEGSIPWTGQSRPFLYIQCCHSSLAKILWLFHSMFIKCRNNNFNFWNAVVCYNTYNNSLNKICCGYVFSPRGIYLQCIGNIY